ncbi:GlxA family transcriptional regulator [Mucilaginibacter pocheonensis]|uniref:Transcriptional regulator GlxA family with amidase domain n=1 Tax=Mucilaginibacter pocheonensis TaxID=398050 RepID=A0ABU1TF04_9SPHI|nr:helix-turn-helix domain-containing protein [Mucilaginibacter pocheonensis]MDR6943904.1 transcriptional regulator GlxA family with amidase domain [Mucilaginibacter pocheonensis]
MNGNTQKKKVVIVVMSGNMLLNFSGPSDVFTTANRCLIDSGKSEGYEVMIAAPTRNRKAITETGVEIHCPYYAVEIEEPIDTLIIAGNDMSADAVTRFADFHHWLSNIDTFKTRRIASICGGAFALAKAGLLDGKKATTHWDRSEKLKKDYPNVLVNANHFHTSDGNIYTSAGVSSGIDLSLAMVEEDHGKDIAIRVARKLVFYLSRPGFQSQFGNLLPVYESENIAEKLQLWLKDHLNESLDIARIADHLNMSTRNFTRVFHKQTGLPPAKFIEKVRVEAARKLLEDTDVPLERIAEDCGLINLVGMRRTFLRHLDITPSDYRRTFRTALKAANMDDLLLTK